jgi:hypothetical protein
MTKLLNLDELPTRFEKTIVLNGKRHEMRPLSVGQFIEQQKTARRLDGDADIGDAVEMIIETICGAFPTMTPEELRSITFDKLNAIFEFLRDQEPEVPAEAKASGK